MTSLSRHLFSSENNDVVVRLSQKDKWILKDERVFRLLLNLDDKHLPSPTYFLFQTDLKEYMRRMVGGWMVEVCDEQGCHEDVLVTAINYLDRFLSVHKISRSELQLVGAVCMFIASKFKDSTPIGAQMLVMYTDWSIECDQLLEWEWIVLLILKWELSCASPYDFIDQLLARLIRLNEEQRTRLRRHASTLVVMTCIECQFSICPPSLIASACLSAAATGLFGVNWCESTGLQQHLSELTSIDEDSLRNCQEQIEELLRMNMSSGPNSSGSNPSEGIEDGEEGTSAGEDSLSSTSSSSTPRKPRTVPLPTTPTDIRDIHPLAGPE